MANLNTRSSRPLIFAILMTRKVASVEYPIASKRAANKSVMPIKVANFAGR